MPVRDCRIQLNDGKFPTYLDTFSQGGRLKQYRVPYCIDLESPTDTDGIASIISQIRDSGNGFTDLFPSAGSVYQFGGEIDVEAFYATMTPLTRSKQHRGKFLTEVTFQNFDQTNSNGGGNTPENLFQRVEIEFQETERPGDSFIYLGLCDGEGTQFGSWFGQSSTPPGSHGSLRELVISKGDFGPIRNTAGCPIERNVLDHRHILRVTNYATSWSNQFTNALRAWNEFDIRVVEFNDSTVLFDETYPALTLQILNVGKETIDFFGTQILALTWVMEYNPEGYVKKELDAGTQAAFLVGAADPKLLEQFGAPGWVQGGDPRLEQNKTGKRDLNSSERVMLNGEGAEWGLENTEGVQAPIFIASVDASESVLDFSTLPVYTSI